MLGLGQQSWVQQVQLCTSEVCVSTYHFYRTKDGTVFAEHDYESIDVVDFITQVMAYDHHLVLRGLATAYNIVEDCYPPQGAVLS